MSAEFTIEAILAHVPLDEEYRANNQPTPFFQGAVNASNGNIKLEFTRLTSGNSEAARGLDDYKKVCILRETADALTEQGYEVTVRLSQRNAAGAWTSWPHIWVNKTARAVVVAQNGTDARDQQIQQLLEQNAKLMQMFIQSQQASAETEAPAPPPLTEQVEVEEQGDIAF